MPIVIETVLGRPMERRNCSVECMDRGQSEQLHLHEEIIWHLRLHVGGVQYVQNT